MQHPIGWLFGGLIALFSSACLCADEKPKQGPLKLRVALRFTVEQFDPDNPKDGFLECVVRNDTPKPIEVPIGYSKGYDSDIVVFGRIGTNTKGEPNYSRGWDLRLIRESGKKGDKAATILVPSGKSQEAFRANLGELLLPKRGEKLSWSWQA